MSRVLAFDPGARLAGAALFVDGVLRRAALVRGVSGRGEASLDDLVTLAGNTLAWAMSVDDSMRLLYPNVVVAEQMKVYRAPWQKGDQADLLRLSVVTGALAGLLRAKENPPGTTSAVWYTAHDWKGSLPKPKDGEEYVVKTRVEARLRPEELARVEPCARTLEHNVYDALGLGLFHLGRFDRKRVIAR